MIARADSSGKGLLPTSQDDLRTPRASSFSVGADHHEAVPPRCSTIRACSV